ncbi:unnamed protein product [Euphydryas editha]|uniref:Transposase n=1 Tax=Euphydryas editha TaxID=104508 RepID=A0AAU9TPA2_EUPED|nr:unnamed protein product [Euphydryas editha]
MDETWVHHFDPETKQQSMVWKKPSWPTPKKFKVSSSAGKIMASGFWAAEGIIMIDYLEKGASITGSYYADQIKKCGKPLRRKGEANLSQSSSCAGCHTGSGLRIGRASSLFSRSGPQRLLYLSPPQGTPQTPEICR